MRRAYLAVLCLELCACQKPSSGAAPNASASSRPIQTPAENESLQRSLRSAELARSPAQIPDDALASAHLPTRRLAARALSRSAGPGELDALFALLADGDHVVASYAAFGLGRGCNGRESDVVAALTLRAASWQQEAAVDSDGPWSALTQALSRCGNDGAERSLRAWLTLAPELASAAAVALGGLASQRGKLDDETFVALLDAASRTPPLDTALYPLTRVLPEPGALREHTSKAALAALAHGSLPRTFAIRALGRLNAVVELEPLLREADFSDGDRAEAARELAQAGPAGQKALAAALLGWVPSDDAARRIGAGPGLPTVLSLLEGLSTAPDSVRPALSRLAALDVPSQDAAKRRRAVALRCAAARLLAGVNMQQPELASCDPEPDGRVGKLALLFVLDREPLRGARDKRYQALLRDSDANVRQAALRLLPAHREVTNSQALLGEALAALSPGVVATAAEILAHHPGRGLEPGRGEDAAKQTALIAALTQALRSDRFAHNPIVRATLVDAAGSLGVLGLVGDLQQLCAGPNATLRARAERALRTLTKDVALRCVAKAAAAPPSELDHLVTRALRLEFETDAGNLTLELDPSDAPLSVTRVADLVRAGFYDGTWVHRAVPGFIVQFGDPSGDGYGGAPRPALAAELTPFPFEAGAVGIAQAGLDTGVSQLFVTLGRFPHLDGESTRIGHAGPGWAELVPGDRIRRVRALD